MDDRNNEQGEKLNHVVNADPKLPWHAPQVFPLGVPATRSGSRATFTESVHYTTPTSGTMVWHGDLS